MKKLLLIDDDPFGMKMLEEIFKKEWKILNETTLEQIVDRVRKDVPDVIVLNMMLRRTEGEPIFEALREEAPGIPIVVYGPANQSKTGRSFVRRGAFWYLTMPLNTDDLERIVQIATAIEEHRKSAFATQQDFANLDEGITRISLPLQKNLADNFTFEQDDLIQGIIDLLGDLLQVDKVSLMLIDHNKKELRIKAAKGLDPYVIANTTKALGEGIAGRVAQEGKPLLIKNVEENGEYSESPFFQQYSTKSLVCVPLKAGEMVVGVLSANNKYAGTPFDEHDLYMATIFSHLLLLTLQNAQLHFDRERFLTQESSLGVLNRKIASSLEPRLLYQTILDECRKLIHADFAFLFELDEKGTGCGVHYLNESEMKEGVVPNGAFRQWLANRSVPNLVFGSPDDSHFAFLQNLTGKEFYAWCSVPIILHDRLAGSLEVSNETARRFRETDKQFLLKVAHQASLAISNARLYIKLLDSLKEISQARKEVEKMRREQYN